MSHTPTEPHSKAHESGLADAVAAGDDARALACAVALWQRHRDVDLARLAERLGERLAVHVPRGSLDDWLALAKDAPIERRGPLLAQLGERTWRDTLAQLDVIASWEPDPRTAAALVRLVTTKRFRGGPTRPLWDALFRAMLALADPRVEAALAVNAAVYSRAFPTPEMHGRIWAQLPIYKDRVSAALEPVPPVPDDLDLHALLEVVKSRAGRPSLERLEQAVYDNPTSDEARLVYADALLEHGDPRGELITLQLLPGKPAKAQRDRVKALLKEYAALWLGPLSRVFYRGSLVYRRGFIAEGDLDCKSAADVEAVTGLAQWRTLEALRVIGGSSVANIVALLTAPELSGLERLGRVGGATAPLLIDRDEAWALEAMQIWGHYADTGQGEMSAAFAKAFEARAAAANIVELGLMYSSSPTPWKDDWSRTLVKLAGRLHTFEIASDSQSEVTHEQWLLGSVERELPVPTQRYTCIGGYRHRSGWEYELARSDEGTLQLRCAYKHRPGRGDHFGRLAELLAELPAAKVAALTVKAPRYSPTEAETVRLRAVVDGLALDQPAKLPG